MADRNDWAQIFQDAAFDPSTWPDALRRLAEATGAARGQLIGIGGASLVPFNWINDFPDAALADFERIGGASPAHNYRIAADGDRLSGAIVHEADYRRATTTLKDDCYRDFCRDTDIPHGCHTALVQQGELMIGLATLRTRTDGESTGSERAIFAEAIPAVRAAVRLQAAIEHRGSEMMAGSFDALSLECFLIDGMGCVSAMSAGARERIASSSALRIVDGRLKTADARATRHLDLALRAIVSNADSVASRRVAGDPALEVLRLHPRDWSFGFQPCAMVVVRDPARRLIEARERIAAGLQLSPAEADVAILLALGDSRATIAVKRGVSIHTLRTQIRSLYAKTGCAREVELVNLVYRWAD